MNSHKIYPTSLVACILVLASCSDEIASTGRSIAKDDFGKDEITISLEDQTRTYLSQNGEVYNVLWSEGDAITLIGADGGNSTFTLSAGSGTKCGKFAGDLAAAGTAPYCAIYPASESGKLKDGNLVFEIASDNGKIPAVASVTIKEAQAEAGLHNIFGLLKVTLTSAVDVKIKRLTLRDLAGNMLWGSCSVPLSGGIPDYENVSLEGGDNSVSLTADDWYELGANPTTFCFPVPVASLDRGFSIVLYEYDRFEENEVGRAYTFLQKISSPTAAERSVILAMDSFEISEKSEPLEIKERGYYKSLFVNAGCYLSNYYLPEHLPVLSELGLDGDYEYIATATTSQLNGSSEVLAANKKGQNAVMLSSPQDGMTSYSDANGVLIYPDGEPRFRAMFVNGGTSYNFGPTLTQKGRQQVHDWFFNGGSYIGVCAGTFLCTTYRDGTNRWNNPTASKNYSFGIWPGEIKGTSIPISIVDYAAVGTGAKVLEDYTKLNYVTDFARCHGKSGRAWQQLSVNDTIEDLAHHGGSFLPHTATNAQYPHEEFIAMQWSGQASKWVPDSLRYLENKIGVSKPFKTSKKLHDSTIVWAYKKDSQSGRAVLSGSHPEKRGVGSGRNFNLFANMILHAFDGVGAAEVKGELPLNGIRKMNRTTADADPAYTRIGDRQYHHFILNVDKTVENFRLELMSDYDSDSGIDLYLTLRKGDLAWMSDADYLICSKGGQKVLNIKNLAEGQWYVGVYCATTVTAEPFSYNAETGPFFMKYGGHTEVLDGIPYIIACEADAESGVSGIDILPGHDLGSDKLDD